MQGKVSKLSNNTTNASILADGSATFAGNVEVSADGTNKALIHKNGFVSNDRSSGANTVFEGKLSGSQTSLIKADGSATFASNVLSGSAANGVTLYSSGVINAVRSSAGSSSSYFWKGIANGVETSAIATDGSAEFAGRVDIGSFNNSQTSGAGFQLYETGAMYVQVSSTTGDASNLLRCYKGTSLNASISADGSATFAGDITDSKGDIRAIPQTSKTAAYTLVVGDVGKHVNITTGGVTIPSGVFSVGDAISIYNDSSSDQTITQGSSVTLRLAGDGGTGNKTLAGYGLCTVLCVTSNEFVIAGTGLS